MTRRAAVVLADLTAVPPPGIDAAAFAAASLADTYEVLSDLAEVSAGIAGGDAELRTELLWRDDVSLPVSDPRAVLRALSELGFDEAVLVAADVPDLPGLVVAKLFKALQRADVARSPARGSGASVAVGCRLPLADWVTDLDLDDPDLSEALQGAAPRRTSLASGPDWHRLDAPGQVDRLDPGLEGWDNVRLLLGG